MADWVCHGAIGAGACASAARALKAPPWVLRASSTYGAILGSWPDVGDWLNATLLGHPRWQLYVTFHHDPPWYLIVQPPFFFHWLLDKPFHQMPGVNWWPRLWYLEATMWLIAGSLLWYAYRKVRQPIA